MNKKGLSERDICTKYITPAIKQAGWDINTQIREEVTFTAGRVIVRGKTVKRGKQKRADYILYYKPNIPIAVIEAKENNHSIGSGMQQALGYAKTLDIPFVFSSNGDGFLFHDKTENKEGHLEMELSMEMFPSPELLWGKYLKYKSLNNDQEEIITQDYYADGSGKSPRYYQQIAINKTVEAIAKGQNRLLLVMATGTGKTYTAFQIIWRLWKSRKKKRILFLADRNILVDQTKTNDFKPFGSAMTKIKKRQIDKSYEIYLSLYQAVTGNEEEMNIYKQFTPDFFDLIIIDECHRGSADEVSAWRQILTYFSSASHLGLTATPKETKDISNIDYFGNPVYTYSLKQGIDDGFLAPYRVVRIDIDKDLTGWRPEKGKTDKYGNEIEDRIYNQKDFDRSMILEKRTELVAKKVTEFLKGTDQFSKTIVFCENIDHAERMRQNLVNNNPKQSQISDKYVMRITGDNPEGKAELDNFIDPEARYPVIATTSRLMSTGVDAQTCKLIVLDQRIESMTSFKQIIGRGTRIKEKLLTDCDLHTIIRLPNGVFSPYTGIKTNLLFFTKGEPTKEIWYYEHQYPKGAKSYNKTNPINIKEFDVEKELWEKREESEFAWKVSIEEIQKNNYNLDIKNPNVNGEDFGDPDELLSEYKEIAEEVEEIRNKLKNELMKSLGGKSI